MAAGLIQAVQASLLSGFVATTLGALPLLATPRFSARRASALSGFAAGVMLAAASFSLLLPALEHARASFPDPRSGVAAVVAALLAGAGLLAALERHVPHEHFEKGAEGGAARGLTRTTLIVVAIALHNLPEGFAVGAGVGSGDVQTGLTVTLGIALQNAPEGFVVAAAMLKERYGRLAALAVASLTGLVEPLGSALGWASVSIAGIMLPLGLAFAAGAMIYVVSGEVIPESHRNGRAPVATAGTVAGFALMVVVDAMVG
jgi:ZIP family zinc transporter